MNNFIVQWFTYDPQGTSIHHKCFTDQSKARAFAKALRSAQTKLLYYVISFQYDYHAQ